MKVAFADFWSPFDPDANIFIDAIRYLRQSVVVTMPEEADIIFSSLFGTRHANFAGKIPIIKFFGEPRSFSPLDGMATLGFDYDDVSALNFRLPLWLLQFNWFNNNKSYLNPNALIEPKLLHQVRKVERRRLFAAAIFNHDPCGNRVRMLKALLGSGMPVSAFGKPFGNWFFGEETKLSVLSEYQFNVCFENNNMAGYHTEKLVHAYFSGCIPVYWGSSTHSLDFNPGAYLFLHDGIDENCLVQQMIEISTSSTKLTKILEQPLFTSVPSINSVLIPIDKALRSLGR
jgi:hypothetical protein